MVLSWHLYVMALLYFLAGLNHFRRPQFYTRIIPPALPAPKVLNAVSGLAEIVLAVVLCIPALSHWAAWGIIALLVAVFPANIYMYTHNKAALGLPKWMRLIRLPLQAVFIGWAYMYT